MRSVLPALLFAVLLIPTAATATLPTTWRELEPIFGGPVHRITVDSAGSVWLSTPGGVFKSADAGASWASARGDLPSVPTGGAILADPVTAGTVYLWMSQGFYRTTDGGTTWTRLPLELPTGVYVNEIAVAPSDPTRLFVATWGDYVYRSLDHGATWEKRAGGLSGGWSGPSYVTAVAVDPADEDRVYTSTWRGLLFRSDDGATTWSQMSGSGTWANTQMHVATASPNVLYMLHDEASFGRGTVLRSADHGDTWTSPGRPDGPGETWQLAVDPTDEDVVYAASRFGLYKSVDGGGSWTRILEPSGRPEMGSVGLDPGNLSRIYGGSAINGLHRSLDGGSSWEESSGGLAATLFTALEIVRDAPATVYAGVQGMGHLKSTDGGGTWAVIGTAQGLQDHYIGALAAHPADPETVVLSTSDSTAGHIWRSTDGGTSFTETATGYGPSWLRFNPHTPAVVNASVSDWQGGFLRSADTGASWSVPYWWYIYPLDYDYHPTLPNVVLSVANQYTGAALTTLHVVWSSNAGASWTGTPLTTSLWRSDVALDQNDPATLYLASELAGEGTQGVYKFTVTYSGGNVASVTRLPGTFNSGLTDTKILRLVYDKTHSALYAATPSGVFRSLDQAATWTGLPGLPHPPGQYLAVTPDGSRLLAGTSGGVWELGPNAPPVAEAQSASTAEDTPLDLTLAGSDPEGGSLSFSIVSAPQHGSLSGTPPGVTYTPDADWFGPDGFTFEVSDGSGTDQAEVSLTVTPVNDPPFFDPIADLSIPHGSGPLTVQVTGIVPGPANESDQTVTLSAVSDAPGVASSPAISWGGPVLLDEISFGGTGDQQGRGIAIANGALWLSAYSLDQGGEGLVARFDLPPGPAPAWSRLWPAQPGWDELPGIGASEEGVYAAGRSWSQTTDGVGDKEAKGVVVKLNPDGSDGPEATGAVWVHKPHFHPYTGHEGFHAATVREEAGEPRLYAAGAAQVNGCNHRPMALKMDAAGSEAWRFADLSGTCGDAMAFALAVDAGSVYLAGRVVAGGVAYPYLAKLSAADGTLQWERSGAAHFPSGTLYAVAVANGKVYVGGGQAGAGGGAEDGEDWLLDAWSEDGTHLPLSSPPSGGGRADRITGLAASASRLWAVGHTRSDDDPGGNGGLGFADGVLFELSPDTGAAFSAIPYGAASGQDETFQAVAVSGMNVYVAGSGNGDAVLLRYGLTTAGLQLDPLAPGTAVITVTAGDGQAENNLFSRTFTVTVTNAPPDAVDDAATTPEITPVEIAVLGNDQDPEGDLVELAGHTQGANGSVTCGGSSCSYAPNLGFQGSDSFTYTIEDGFGAADTATVSVTVTPSPGFDFYTVVPCRLLDTRPDSPLVPGTARIVTVAGLCGIPATARAVMVNVTVTGSTAAGHLALFPGGDQVPGTSVINFAAGRTRANNAHLVLAPSGDGTVEALATLAGGSGQVHLVLDVSGYYE